LFDSRRDEEAGLLEDEGALHLPSSSHVIFHLTHGRHTNYGTTGMLRSNARAVELALAPVLPTSEARTRRPPRQLEAQWTRRPRSRRRRSASSCARRAPAWWETPLVSHAPPPSSPSAGGRLRGASWTTTRGSQGTEHASVQ
jgi:hypothetical protein